MGWALPNWCHLTTARTVRLEVCSSTRPRSSSACRVERSITGFAKGGFEPSARGAARSVCCSSRWSRCCGRWWGSGGLEAEALTFEVQAFTRDAERLGCGLDAAAMFAQRRLDHLAFDPRQRRQQLLMQGDDHLGTIEVLLDRAPRAGDVLRQCWRQEDGVFVGERDHAAD